MELSYVIQLGKQDFIDLINFCIEKQKERNVESGMFAPDVTVNGVTIHDEVERGDRVGDRYLWVSSYDCAKVLDGYVVKDFDMAIDNIGVYGRATATDYTASMREFMARRFGKEYIKAVYQYEVSKAEKEMEHLLNCLPKEKKI